MDEDMGSPDRPTLETASPEQVLQALLRKLAEVRGKANTDVDCPICGRDSWSVGALSEIRVYEPSSGAKGVYPLVPTFCETCGYTMLFNTFALGIKPEDGEPWDSGGRV